MKPGAHILIVAAARFYLPLIALFAIALLLGKLAGSGVGFSAGLATGIALALHLLVFGAAAAASAFPPFIARALLVLGLLLTLGGAAFVAAPMGLQIAEAGLFLVTTSAIALILLVLSGRAPTLRDEAL